MEDQNKEQESRTEEDSTSGVVLEPPTPTPAEASDELKVVVTIKGRKAIISVGSPDCDPRIELREVKGDGDPLVGAIALIPEVVSAARTQWAAARRYPAHKAPPQAPPQPQARVATTATTYQATKGAAAKPKAPEPAQHTLPLL